MPRDGHPGGRGPLDRRQPDRFPFGWPTRASASVPADSAQSYLNIPQLIAAAEVTDADAIHPGYGFLAENATFAEICRACSIRFIGPSPEVIRLLGDKVRARELARKADVPLLPGSDGAVRDEVEAQSVADTLGYPVLLKASLGGGGRGIRIVWDADSLATAVRTCQSEAAAAFGSSEIYLEKYVEGARHVEVQILADGRGQTIHLGERDCSIQRRHQKLLEETPCPSARRRDAAGADRRGAAALPGGGLRERGHRRVPARPAGPLLLPRGQHAHPGRASGDRDGYRHRPGSARRS